MPARQIRSEKHYVGLMADVPGCEGLTPVRFPRKLRQRLHRVRMTIDRTMSAVRVEQLAQELAAIQEIGRQSMPSYPELDDLFFRIDSYSIPQLSVHYADPFVPSRAAFEAARPISVVVDAMRFGMSKHDPRRLHVLGNSDLDIAVRSAATHAFEDPRFGDPNKEAEACQVLCMLFDSLRGTEFAAETSQACYFGLRYAAFTLKEAAIRECYHIEEALRNCASAPLDAAGASTQAHLEELDMRVQSNMKTIRWVAEVQMQTDGCTCLNIYTPILLDTPLWELSEYAEMLGTAAEQHTKIALLKQKQERAQDHRL